MPALRNGLVIDDTKNACVFCGETVTDDNCVDWSDMDIGGISHEVCPENLRDSDDITSDSENPFDNPREDFYSF